MARRSALGVPPRGEGADGARAADARTAPVPPDHGPRMHPPRDPPAPREDGRVHAPRLPATECRRGPHGGLARGRVVDGAQDAHAERIECARTPRRTPPPSPRAATRAPMSHTQGRGTPVAAPSWVAAIAANAQLAEDARFVEPVAKRNEQLLVRVPHRLHHRRRAVAPDAATIFERLAPQSATSPARSVAGSGAPARRGGGGARARATGGGHPQLHLRRRRSSVHGESIPRALLPQCESAWCEPLDAGGVVCRAAARSKASHGRWPRRSSAQHPLAFSVRVEGRSARRSSVAPPEACAAQRVLCGSLSFGQAQGTAVREGRLHHEAPVQRLLPVGRQRGAWFTSSVGARCHPPVQ